MSRSLDDWAMETARTGSWFAGLRASRQSRSLDAQSSISRRDALKKAGLISAGVFAAPVIQSVTAPAFATSHTCGNTPNACGSDPVCTGTCPADTTCRTNADCQGTCVGGNGTPGSGTC